MACSTIVDFFSKACSSLAVGFAFQNMFDQMNCFVDALFNEMSRVIVGLKCPGNVSFSSFLASSVEHNFLVLVVRHLFKPRFTVNGWCESNRRYRSVAAGFRYTFDTYL